MLSFTAFHLSSLIHVLTSQTDLHFQMESGLLAGQKKCLGLLSEMKETSSKHEESIRDILSQDLKSAVQTLSQSGGPSASSSSGATAGAAAASGQRAQGGGLTSSAKMDAVKKLVGYIRRIQISQATILQKADQVCYSLL